LEELQDTTLQRLLLLTYRTLIGKVVVNTRNKEAIALYSGSLGAWLEPNRYNKWYQGHDQQLLSASIDWLLANNPVFQRNDVRAHLQVDIPLPLVDLVDDNPEELRPQSRPDFVMNPFQYDRQTRNEDFRFDRLPVGAVLPGPFQEQPPALYRSDPVWRLSAFPICTYMVGANTRSVLILKMKYWVVLGTKTQNRSSSQ
jgi:hypothetical protein